MLFRRRDYDGQRRNVREGLPLAKVRVILSRAAFQVAAIECICLRKDKTGNRRSHFVVFSSSEVRE